MLKILAMFANPGSLLFVLLLLALPLSWWARTRRFGIGLGLLLLVAVVVIGLLPVRELVRPLEDYFPFPDLPAQVDGIIVLGGAERTAVSAFRGQPELNGRAERLLALVTLAKQYPQARLVFSGGSTVPHIEGDIAEADVAAMLVARLGLDPGRVEYERESTNTYENARFSAAQIHPLPGQTWILVTSAKHMPRAVNCFAAVDWPVLPYPVDYWTGPSPQMAFKPLERLYDLDEMSREWIGLVAYRLMGRTRDWLPPRRMAGAAP